MIGQRIGDTVHYVARGSADGRFPSVCRAAIVTEVGEDGRVGLAVLNPTGIFLHAIAAGGCEYHDGAGEPGRSDCPSRETHGDPHRYCQCGWTEPAHLGGTWHRMDGCTA